MKRNTQKSPIKGRKVVGRSAPITPDQIEKEKATIHPVPKPSSSKRAKGAKQVKVKAAPTPKAKKEPKALVSAGAPPKWATGEAIPAWQAKLSPEDRKFLLETALAITKDVTPAKVRYTRAYLAMRRAVQTMEKQGLPVEAAMSASRLGQKREPKAKSKEGKSPRKAKAA